MKYIDLTHTIAESMPVYPGTDTPKLVPGSSYEEDGFRETILTMFSHTGTHMDAPNHLFPVKTMLDEFPIDQFIGSALVVDCTKSREGDLITMESIAPIRDLADKADFLLFYTGWSQHWGSAAYFGNYPCLDFDVIEYMIATRKKGIGLDTIGLDPIADTGLTRHRMLFEKNETVIIENLTNLGEIGPKLFTFMALPIKFEESDGAPVRAVACLQD